MKGDSMAKRTTFEITYSVLNGDFNINTLVTCKALRLGPPSPIGHIYTVIADGAAITFDEEILLVTIPSQKRVVYNEILDGLGGLDDSI
jgi:hypothetical protein